MRLVVEEVKSNDSNSTLEDVSSIDDINTTSVNNDFSKNPLPETNGCCEEPEDGEDQNPLPHNDIPTESIDKMLVKLG